MPVSSLKPSTTSHHQLPVTSSTNAIAKNDLSHADKTTAGHQPPTTATQALLTNDLTHANNMMMTISQSQYHC